MGNEFDRYAKSYDQILEEAMPEGFAEDSYFARYKVDLMARELGDTKVESVLDFGCGTGRSLGFIQQAYPRARITGYDASPESIEIARRRLPGVTLTAEWSELRTRSFDCIFVANVFHHIAECERQLWLEHCHEALSERGQLFWFEHNPINPLTRRVFERCPFDADAKMIGRAEALSLMRRARLKVLNTGYTLFFPRPLANLRPLEPFLRNIPLGAQYYVKATK